MDRWPKEFIFKIASAFIFFTCFMFTFVTLGDAFIIQEEQTKQELISTLVMGMILSVISLWVDRKKWKQKLAQINSGLESNSD